MLHVPTTRDTSLHSEIRVTLEIMTEGEYPRQLVIERGVCLIGSSPLCDIILKDADVPPIHSELHVDEGAVWIEAVEDGSITINGNKFRRLALRDGDIVSIGNTTLVVRILPGEQSLMLLSLPSDLRRLSPEELCRRIEQEQTLLEERDRSRIAGWLDLLDRVLTDAKQGESASGKSSELQVLSELKATLAQLLESSSKCSALLESLEQAEATQRPEEAGIDYWLKELPYPREADKRWRATA